MWSPRLIGANAAEEKDLENTNFPTSAQEASLDSEDADTKLSLANARHDPQKITPKIVLEKKMAECKAERITLVVQIFEKIIRKEELKEIIKGFEDRLSDMRKELDQLLEKAAAGSSQASEIERMGVELVTVKAEATEALLACKEMEKDIEALLITLKQLDEDFNGYVEQGRGLDAVPTDDTDSTQFSRLTLP